VFNLWSKPTQKGSKGQALLFFVIAIIGLVLIYTYPPASHPNTSTVVQKSSDDGEQKLALQRTDSGHFGRYILRTMVVTAMIIVMILAISRIYRRRQKSDIPDSYDLNIIGRKYLGPRSSLLVVKFGKKQLLLGVTDSGIQRLSENPCSEDPTPEYPKRKI